MTKENVKIRPLLASIIGGAIEFYDLAIFGIMGAAVSKHYFPDESSIKPIILVYLTFAVGFMARPLGSIIFGILGDTAGRKKAFTYSLLLMSFSTLVIGISPGYQHINILAPILLIICRILQGISAGGEYTGGMIFAIEHNRLSNRTGFVGAITASGCMSGLVIGSMVGSTCYYLIDLYSINWIWRAPFILGFLASLVGIYIRLYTTETPSFKAINKRAKPHLKSMITRHSSRLAIGLALAAFNGAALYFYFINLHDIVNQLKSVHTETFRVTVSIGSAFMLLGMLFFGFISDKIDKVKMMMLGLSLTCVTYLILIYDPFNLNIENTSKLLLMYALSFSIYTAPLNTFIVELFPVHVRYSYASISYSLGVGVIGGLTPLITTVLTSTDSVKEMLCLYFLVLGGAAFLSLIIFRFSSHEE